MITLTKITYELDEKFRLQFTNNWEGKYYHLQIINGDLTPLCYIPPASSGSVLCISGISNGYSSSRIYELLVKNTYWIGKIYLLDAPKWLMDKIEEVKACNEDFGISFAIEKNNANNIHNITPNISKYIPEDNAVLFLSGEKLSLVDYDDYYNMFSGYRDIEFEGKIIEGMPYHPQIYGIHTIGDRVSVHKHEHDIDDYTNFTLNILKGNKITIFIHYGTQSELQKANEVAKELMEKYGVEEVNLFVLHWFLTDNWEYNLVYSIVCDEEDAKGIWHGDKFGELVNNEIPKRVVINKIITTTSTGILRPKDSSKRIQVIDCKETLKSI